MRGGHVFDRELFQAWLGVANPRWAAYLDALESQLKGLVKAMDVVSKQRNGEPLLNQSSCDH